MSHSVFNSTLSRITLRPLLSRRSIHSRLNSTLIPPEDHTETLGGSLQSGQSKTRARLIINSTKAKYRGKFPPPPPLPKGLLTVLHSLGHAVDILENVPGKKDLSFIDPIAPMKKIARKRLWLWNVKSLKGITEMFIYHFYYLASNGSSPPDLESQGFLRKVFRKDVVDYLASRGYRPEDVLVWAWILMAKDGTEAVLRIDVWSKVGVKMEIPSPERQQELKDKEGPEKEDDEHPMATGASGRIDPAKEPFTGLLGLGDSPPQPVTRTPNLPPFVLLFILRHPSLNASTISLLLPHIHQIVSSPLPPKSRDYKTPLLILLRLLRHARSSWPTAIPMCAELITTYIHPTTTTPPTPSARLTMTYNRLLSLFSLPTGDRPFKSVPLHQHSQFTVLRKMASLDIPVTREGYRALVNIQLAQGKTLTEACRAESLSTNWPPWPVPKDGYDRSPGRTPHDRYLSRAAQVLRQMAEAGYSHLGWEQEALVLAGTDTDFSPTIQTRSFYHDTRNCVREKPGNIWAVRVRATRTLEEAWSILLDCINVSNTPSPETWEEMFEKIISARNEQRLRASQERQLKAIKAAYRASPSPSDAPTQDVVQALDRWYLMQRAIEERKRKVLPGDAKEVRPPPASPSEGIYVGVPPPGVEELYMMMMRVCGRDYTVRRKLIRLLVRESETVEVGQFLMRKWYSEQYQRLMRSAVTNEMIDGLLSGQRKYKRDQAPLDYSILTSYLHLLISKSTISLYKHTSPHIDRTDLAVRLLLGQLPRYPPAWNTVLSGLINFIGSCKLEKNERWKRALLLWRLFKASEIYAVPTDTETLRLLCVAAEKSLFLSDGLSKVHKRVLWDGVEPVDQVVSIFTKTVGLDNKQKPGVPPLLVPEFATLHAYVRLLGFTGRHGEIVKLLEWMRAGAMGMGGVMGRRVLVACRVFLKNEAFYEAKEVVESWLGGEGWPDRQEVEDYYIMGWSRLP